MLSRNTLLAIALIFAAAATRLLPHPDNVTPIAATGLFGAAYMRRYWAVLVPFMGLFLSDLFLNNVIYSAYYDSFVWITSWWVYAAFAVVIGIGYVTFGKEVTLNRTIGATLLGSVVFFLISNLSTFFETSMYPHNAAGLLACYTAGLPFFARTLLGDLAFVAILFGGYAWMMRTRTFVQPTRI
jgi:hypothetical protein